MDSFSSWTSFTVPIAGMGAGSDQSGSSIVSEAQAMTSIYGQGRVKVSQIMSGANLADAAGQKSFYDLGNGFSSPTGSDHGAVTSYCFGYVRCERIFG